MGYRRTATRAALERRAEVLARIRDFFATRDVLEVETPALAPAAPTDPAIESIAATAVRLGGVHYLHTSPEFAMKRLLASGSGDIYQICRVFRDNELGRWHQPEFTLLEWYRVGYDDEKLMDEVAALVRHAAGGDVAGWPVVRVGYAEAMHAATGIACDDATGAPAARSAVDAGATQLAARLRALGIDVPPGIAGDALLDLALGAVVVPGFRRDTLTFVHDYPLAQAALARIKPGGTGAARFELFAGGLELANGFFELTDSVEQRSRFLADHAVRRRTGLPLPPLDEDLLAVLDDVPDCAGVAVGIDRLVALATGATSLAEVLAFAHET